MDAPPVDGAALVLTIRDEQHVTLTTEQIKKMPWQQHAKIWKVRFLKNRNLMYRFF